VATSALPPRRCEPAGAHLIQSASWLRGLVRYEEKDNRGIVVGLEGLDNLLGHDRAGQLGASIRRNGVDVDVILLALKRERLGEAKNTALGRGIVCLAKVAVDAAGRGSVEDAAVLLLEHVWPCGL
jgi:hypothetical protein